MPEIDPRHGSLLGSHSLRNNLLNRQVCRGGGRGAGRGVCVGLPALAAGREAARCTEPRSAAARMRRGVPVPPQHRAESPSCAPEPRSELSPLFP